MFESTAVVGVALPQTWLGRVGLLVVSILAAVVGFELFVSGRALWRTYREEPISPSDAAKLSERTVEVEGTVEPFRETLTAPVEGEEVVHYSAEVERYKRTRRGSNTWERVDADEGDAAFLVRHDSGEAALVTTTGADFELDTETYYVERGKRPPVGVESRLDVERVPWSRSDDPMDQIARENELLTSRPYRIRVETLETDAPVHVRGTTLRKEAAGIDGDYEVALTAARDDGLLTRWADKYVVSKGGETATIRAHLRQIAIMSVAMVFLLFLLVWMVPGL